MKAARITSNNQFVQEGNFPAGTYTFNALVLATTDFYYIRFEASDGMGVIFSAEVTPNEWSRAEMTFTLSRTFVKLDLSYYTYNPVVVAAPMLEHGNNASTASPNPDDIDEELDDLGGSIISMGTEITQTKAQIQLLAEKTVEIEGDISNMGSSISSMEAAITLQAGLISGKVSQSDFNSLGQRVSTAEAAITIQAGEISSLVSAVDSHGSQISLIGQKADSIEIKVDNFQVGGRNYLLDSENFDKIYDVEPDSISSVKGQDDGVNWIYGSYSGKYMIYTYGISYGSADFTENLIGKKVVISVEVKSSHAMNVGFYDYSEDISYTRIPTNKWTRIHLVTYANSSSPGLAVEEESIPLGTKLYYRNWKVETGDAPTDWSPAQEDLPNQLSGTGIDIKTGVLTLYSGVKGDHVGGKIVIAGSNFSVDESGKIKANEAEISGKISSSSLGDRITIDPSTKKMQFIGSDDLVFIDMAFDVVGSDKTSRIRINSYLSGSLIEYTDYRARGQESYNTSGGYQGVYNSGRIQIRKTPSYGLFSAEVNRGESWADNKLIVTMSNLPTSSTNLPSGTLYRNGNQIMIV